MVRSEQKDALSTQLSDLQASLANSTDTSNVYEQQLAEMRKAAEDVGKLQHQIIDLEKTIANKEAQCAAHDETISKLRQEIEQHWYILHQQLFLLSFVVATQRNDCKMNYRTFRHLSALGRRI